MEFKEFRSKLQEHFDAMAANNTLFSVSVDKDEMWNTYLDSFPPGTNLIYRTRREYDCSCCRQFIRTVGNVVVIKNNQLTTIWDLELGDDTYQVVADAMAAFIKSRSVTDIYYHDQEKIGTEYNFERYEDGTLIKWDHFQVMLPRAFVKKKDQIPTEQGNFRDIRNVFKRSLEEISVDSIETVLELIYSNSLYKGEEWKRPLTIFLEAKKEYDALVTEAKKDNYVWAKVVKVGPAIGKIKNHSVGTLLINIGEGMELDLAVRKYEQIVAPSNYKRPKAIFTQKMLEDAKKELTELGYIDFLSRRHATLDDITVNNILFSNKDAAKRIVGGADIFAKLGSKAVVDPKKFSRAEEISIENFIERVLPTATGLELFLENRYTGNMVSLIAPEDARAKTMFKWNNAFSWAYSGNITDSMKQRVKEAGGQVDGDLRFSIQWNDTEEFSQNDLDAHCIEPNNNEIYFAKKRSYYTDGKLDVDIMSPQKDKAAVENITWNSRRTMKDGTYEFFVRQYANRGGKDGFRAEIEFDDQLYSFDYPHELRQGQDIAVAAVTLRKGIFTIKEKLQASTGTSVPKELWGVKTMDFVPVSIVCYSPNYWDEQKGIGHKHVLFMLKGCVNPEEPNGMFNEFIKEDLMKYKRVLEALGSACHVTKCDDQLSGVGFSTTKRDEVVVKVIGKTERIMRIKF